MPGSGRFDPVRRAALALAGGGAVAVGFPPYDAWPLVPVGLAALILALPSGRGGIGFLLGFLFGLGFMLPLLHWITVIGADAWIALSALEAVFYGCLGTTWAWLRSTRWWPFGYAACWVLVEVVRGVIPFGGLPWGRLAFGLVDTPMVRYGRLGGAELVSFVTVLVVALVMGVLLRRRTDTRAALGLAAAALLVGAAPLIPVGPAGPTSVVRVAAVQGNVPGRGMNPFAERRAVLNNHAAATHALAARVRAGNAKPPDLVIWPENSTDIDPFSDRTVYAQIEAAVRDIGVPTLVGAVIGGPDGNHDQNVGIVWDPRTGPGERYVKRHVVPFGEYIPFRSLLTRFISRLNQIPVDFAPGHTPGVLQVGPATVGDVICFEVAYDGLVRDVINGGGQVLVVQTNNATYTGTGQLVQQFAISRYRAIETGRTVVIAATSGISGIVAPDGSVVAATAVGTRAVLDDPVRLATGVTPGVRFGGTLDIVLSALGIGLAGAARLGLRWRVGTMAT